MHPSPTPPPPPPPRLKRFFFRDRNLLSTVPAPDRPPPTPLPACPFFDTKTHICDTHRLVILVFPRRPSVRCCQQEPWGFSSCPPFRAGKDESPPLLGPTLRILGFFLAMVSGSTALPLVLRTRKRNPSSRPFFTSRAPNVLYHRQLHSFLVCKFPPPPLDAEPSPSLTPYSPVCPLQAFWVHAAEPFTSLSSSSFPPRHRIIFTRNPCSNSQVDCGTLFRPCPSLLPKERSLTPFFLGPVRKSGFVYSVLPSTEGL